MGFTRPFTLSGDETAVQTVYMPAGKVAKKITLTNTGTVTIYFWPAWMSIEPDDTLSQDHVVDANVSLSAADNGAYTTAANEVLAVTNKNKMYLKEKSTGKLFKIQSCSIDSVTGIATLKFLGNPLITCGTDLYDIVELAPYMCNPNTWLDKTPISHENAWNFCATGTFTGEGMLICE